MNSVTGIGKFDLDSVSNVATQAAWEESNSTSGVMEWLLPIFPEKATTCARDSSGGVCCLCAFPAVRNHATQSTSSSNTSSSNPI